MYNLPISNIAGPPEPGCLAGVPLSELYSVGPLVAGSGMNITVWSYVDQIAISVIADDLTLHDPHEATDAMLRAFADIRSAAGLPAKLADVPGVLGPAHSALVWPDVSGREDSTHLYLHGARTDQMLFGGPGHHWDRLSTKATAKSRR